MKDIIEALEQLDVLCMDKRNKALDSGDESWRDYVKILALIRASISLIKYPL